MSRMGRIASTGLPAWLRIVVVAGLAAVIAGAGFLSWRWYVRPVTLTIAVGSADMRAFGGQLEAQCYHGPSGPQFPIRF